jgi:hypothetical protein
MPRDKVAALVSTYYHLLLSGKRAAGKVGIAENAHVAQRP